MGFPFLPPKEVMRCGAGHPALLLGPASPVQQSKLDPPCPRCHQHGANRQLPSLLGILRLPWLPVSSPGAGSEALGLQDSQPPHTQLPPTLSDGLLGAT